MGNRSEKMKHSRLDLANFLEQLESRRLLSGNVTAVIAGGELFLTGDRLANQISLDQLDLEAGSIRISPFDADTTINGRLDPLVLPGLASNINIILQGGGDTLRVQGVTIPGNMLIDGGDGNNSVLLDQCSPQGTLGIINGKGNSSVRLLGGNSSVSSTVSFAKGSSSLSIDGGTYLGEIIVSAGPGRHTIDVSDAVLQGRAQFDMGKGNTAATVTDSTFHDVLIISGLSGPGTTNTVSISGSTVTEAAIIGFADGNTNITMGGTFESYVHISADAGNHQVELDGATVTGRTLILDGNGSRQISLRNSTLEGLLVEGGTGRSELRTSGVTFNGSMELTFLRGDTIVDLKGTSSWGLQLTAAAGRHSLAVSDLTMASNASFGYERGACTFDIADSLFERFLTITAGRGNSSLRTDNTTINEGLSISLGNGNSAVTLGGTFKDEAARPSGALQLNTGVGTHALTMSGLTTSGPTTVVNGRGRSQTTIENSDLAQLKISAGPGDATLAMTNTTAGTDAAAASVELTFANGNTAVSLGGTLRGSSSIRTGVGRHSLTLDGVAAQGPLVIPNGRGRTSTIIRNSTLADNLSIVNSAGDDTLTMEATTVAGLAEVVNGPGASVTTLTGGDGIHMSSLTLANDSGKDAVTIQNLTFTGPVQIANGTGRNTVSLLNVAAGASVSVTGEAGVDGVTLRHLTASGDVTVQTGSGNDALMIDNSTFQQALSVDTAGGRDSVRIATASDEHAAIVNGGPAGEGPILTCHFNGMVSIVLGTGNDILQIGQTDELGNTAEFAGPMFFNGDQGLDTLALADENASAFLPTILNFERPAGL